MLVDKSQSGNPLKQLYNGLLAVFGKYKFKKQALVIFI